MFIQYRPGKDVWAYGVEPAKVRYRLRLARYPALAEYLQAWLKQKPENRIFTLVDVGVGFGRTFLYVDAAGIGDRFEMIGIDIYVLINIIKKQYQKYINVLIVRRHISICQV